jgi:protein O-GlcNAc transferase
MPRIATSWSEYESLAIEYAMNREAYRDLREQIERTRMTMPLFDTKRWVRVMNPSFIVGW